MNDRRNSFSTPPRLQAPKLPPRPRSSTVGNSSENYIAGYEKNILISLDTSSSMYEGNKLKDSISLITRLVSCKHFQDKVDIMYFNTSVYKKMWNVDSSTNFNDTQGGGTKIEVALNTAFDHLASSSHSLILFLLFSDGLDTISNQEQLLTKYKRLGDKAGHIIVSFFVLIEESPETETVLFLRKLLKDGFCEISKGDFSIAIQDILKTYQDINQPLTRQRIAGVSTALAEIASLAKEAQRIGDLVVKEQRTIKESIQRTRIDLFKVDSQIQDVERFFKQYDGDDTSPIHESLVKLEDSYRKVQADIDELTKNLKQRREDIGSFESIIKDLDKIDRKLQENSSELDYLLNQAKKRLGIDSNTKGLNIIAENMMMKSKQDSLSAFAAKMTIKMKKLSDAVVSAVKQKVEDFRNSDVMKYLESLRREVRKFVASEEVDEGQIQILRNKLGDIERKIKNFNRKLDAIQSL